MSPDNFPFEIHPDLKKQLKTQQDNFIERLQTGLNSLFTFEQAGKFGEKKTISGEELVNSREFCWQMVKKYKTSEPQEIFKNNLKGKIGEEVVKKCLGKLVIDVNYEITEGGDGKIDFTLDFKGLIGGIQVKTRYSSADQVQWYINVEEIERNLVVVCVLIYRDSNQAQEFDEFQSEYSPVMAGFLPTYVVRDMIQENAIEFENGSFIKLNIKDLLHGFGLENYLVSIIEHPSIWIEVGNTQADKSDYKEAIENYSNAIDKALIINPTPNCCADAFYYRGIAYSQIGNYPQANEDLWQAHSRYLAQTPIETSAIIKVSEAIKELTDKFNTHPVGGNTRVPHLDEWSCLHTLDGHANPVRSITTSQDSQILVSGGDDKTIKLWNPLTGKLIRTLSEHSDVVNSVAISPDGQLLVSGSEDKTIKLWNPLTGELTLTLPNPQPQFGNKVYGVALSSDGNTIASGSSDRKVKLWNLDSGEPFKKFSNHGGNVFAVAFSPDDQFLASSSSDRTIIIWNLSSGEYFQTPPDSFFIRSIAISADGQILVSGSDNGKIQVWKLNDGELQLQHTLTEHLDNNQSPHTSPAVAISPDGQVLASGGKDKKIDLWNPHTGNLLHTLSGHSGTILSVAFVGTDGRTLASGSADNTIKIWQLG